MKNERNRNHGADKTLPWTHCCGRPEPHHCTRRVFRVAWAKRRGQNHDDPHVNLSARAKRRGCVFDGRKHFPQCGSRKSAQQPFPPGNSHCPKPDRAGKPDAHCAALRCKQSRCCRAGRSSHAGIRPFRARTRPGENPFRRHAAAAFNCDGADYKAERPVFGRTDAWAGCTRPA